MARTKPRRRILTVSTAKLPPLPILAKRAAVMALALGAAVALGWQSLAVQAGRASPQAAMRFGSKPEARLRAAMLAGLQDQKRLADRQIVRDAKAVLAAQPLDAPALRMLAFQARQSGRRQEALRFARLAEKVTRRETLTQILLAEEDARDGKARSALGHIDMALRATSRGRPVLFTVLAKVMADPQIRREMVGYVDRRAPWLPEFLDHSVRESPAGAANAARLLIAARAETRPRLLQPIAPLLLGMLVDQREFGLARDIHRMIRRGARDLTADASMTRASFDPRFGPFSWTPVEGAASGASVSYEADGEATVSAFASSDEKGVVLSRVLRLPPGAYRLFEKRRTDVGDASARMTWRMSCLGETVEPIWEGPEAPLDYDASGAAGQLVPPGCPAQLLALHANGGSGLQGVEVTISGFDLRR